MDGMPLWINQILAVMRLEIRKTLLGRRAFLLYALAGITPAILGLMVVVSSAFGLPPGLEEFGATMMFAAVVFRMILGFALYLGCVWIFMNLFRGEMLDRSLHYYFMVPIRRDVLVAGKFISGWTTSTVLFGVTTLASFLLLNLAFGVDQLQRHLFDGPGLTQLFWYMVIVALGCLGYGTVFLLIGLFFRNPIVPAVMFWGWEALSFLLPPVLKKLTVIHYLESLYPVEVSQGALAILTEGTPAWITIPGLLIFCAIVMAIAAQRIRRMEVQYGSD
ncbi:hypothetical protein ABI59_20920 [Acidobacteria bacterium Mor1]|nr:hypothetical protein ABI59_20920 [Acidobacteria bacterium Mor1]